MADNHTRIIVSAKDEASKVFQRAGMEAEGLSKRVSRLSGVMGGLVAFGGVSAVGFSVSQAMDKFGQFETALTDMSKVSERDLGAIRKDIESINPALGSSTDLMRGYYQVISAGVTDPKRSLEMLTIASRASQAAHVSQSDTIKALTKVMAGFGDELGNATEASDLLFAMERQGQTSFQELVPVIGDIANLSHEASVGTDELGGAMALLTQTSGSTSEAATKYKALLIGMIKPTKEMGEAFDALGYKSGNALINDKGLVSSLQMLKEYADKSGVSMTSLFGSAEAFMGVSALLAEDGKKLADNIDAMGKSAGSTEKAFKEWGKTWDAVKSKFGNVSENTLMAFGGAFAPELTKGLDSVSDWVVNHGDDIKDWAKSAGDGIGDLTVKIGGLYDFYKSVPDSITGTAGAGLAGRLLFGSWAVGGYLTAITAFGLVVEKAQSVASDMGEVGSWNEGLNKNLYSIFDAFGLDNGVYQDRWGDGVTKRIEKQKLLNTLIKEAQKVDPQIDPEFLTGDYSAEYFTKLSNNSLTDGSSLLALKKVKDAKTAYLEELKSISKLSLPQIPAASNVTKPNLKTVITPPAKKDKNALWLDDKALSKRRTANSKKRSAAWAKRSGRDMTSELKQFEKAEQKKLELVKDFSQEYSNIMDGGFEFEKTAIKAQVVAWENAGADKVKVAAWEKARLEKLEKEHTAFLKKQAREQLIAHGDFFDGMKAGFKDVLEAEKSWAERGIDIANSFSTSAKSALSDFGLDAATGKMKTFSSYWDTFWGGLARSISNHLADMAVNKGLDMLMSMGGGLFDMAGTFMSNIFHTGNIRVGANEVLAKLEENEIVVPAKQSEEIRQAMGSDGISKGQFFDNVVDYVHAGKQQSYADRFNNSQRDAYGWDMLSVARDSLLTGGYNAVQNYMTIGRQAAVLRDQGLNVSQSAVNNAQNSYALSGFVGSFFPSFAGNLVGAWGSRALGLDDNAFSLAGVDISSSTIGNLLASVAGMFLGGPAASIVSGVLSPVFSLGVSALSDAFDMREYETIRDKLEKDLGFIGGRVAYSNFKDAFAPSTIDPGSFNWGFSLQSFTQDQIAQMMIDKMKAISDIGDMPNSVAKTLSKAHMLGNAYTSQMMESKDPAKQSEIAGAIKSDLGFFGYTAREFAAKTLGVGFEFGENYYTADGRKVDINSIENPNSPAYAAARDAIDRANNAGQYSGGTVGGSGHDWGNSWDASRDTVGSGSRDKDGMGNASTGGKSGYGGTSNQGGYTGGRRFGGPVNAGGSYVWNEEGREILIPKTDGYVLSHQDTRQLMSGLQSIANAQKTGTGPVSVASSDSSSTIIVNLHLDGQQLATAIVPGLRELSKHGVQIIHADALIGG